MWRHLEFWCVRLRSVWTTSRDRKQSNSGKHPSRSSLVIQGKKKSMFFLSEWACCSAQCLHTAVASDLARPGWLTFNKCGLHELLIKSAGDYFEYKQFICFYFNNRHHGHPAEWIFALISYTNTSCILTVLNVFFCLSSFTQTRQSDSCFGRYTLERDNLLCTCQRPSLIHLLSICTVTSKFHYCR